jgi:uncharacterized protein
MPNTKNSLPDQMSVDFKTKQLEFTAYIRDPENCAAPADVKQNRMAMYRELIFNNIDSFLSDNFPVLKQIHDDQQWQTLIQDFFSKHKSKSPYFSEIPEEFLDYLENERDNADDFPFILELAHYEWVEMVLAIAKEEVIVSPCCTQNLLDEYIKLSPLAWPLAYQYPVQRIAPDYLPRQAPEQPTCLIVYRDPQYEVHFIEITPITYRLLQLIQENEHYCAKDCLIQVTKELSHSDPDRLVDAGLTILKELAEKGIIQIAA